MNGTTLAKTALAALAAVALLAAGDLPHLRKQGGATQLIVDGKPFIVLGGELHNSSASSLEYLATLWPKLRRLNLNTVLATVSWELIEPEEGRFHWGTVDGIVEQARRNNMKLVLLWFGSWKNGVSTYVPMWVKTDLKRFPRAQNKAGRNLDVVSPFSENARKADARAFRAFMRRLREIDGEQHTVLMVQVQNEVGIKGSSRDFSPLANTEFAKPVHAALLDYLNRHRSALLPETLQLWGATNHAKSGTWAQVLGDNEWGHEAFMAWHYAQYINFIAAEGKKEYALPMFVNAWLQGPNQTPGVYPSGGPVSRVMDFWKAGAPSIDVIAPDIYLPNFAEITEAFTRLGNPLLIPETGRGPDAAGKAFYAFGRHEAMLFAPFGIDSVDADHPIGEAYRVLQALSSRIVASHGKNAMASVLEYKQETDSVDIGGHRLNVTYKLGRDKKGLGYAIIIVRGPDEYLIAGSNAGISFAPLEGGSGYVRIGYVEEMVVRDGALSARRRLNGDETAGGAQVRLPLNAIGVQRVKVYRHE